MDRIWSPWRYQYINANSGAPSEKSDRCVFCEMQKLEGSDEEKGIVYRGAHNFIVLNIFPYTSGHTLIVPYQHLPDFDSLQGESLSEYVALTQRVQSGLRAVYKPDGFNIGMNQGTAAGAGVAGHLHMHVVPRWVGDANFVSIIGETRVLPEDLAVTWKKLKAIFTPANA